MCIARAASCQGTPDTLVSQDLSYGEGGVLETGDSVVMKYSVFMSVCLSVGVYSPCSILSGHSRHPRLTGPVVWGGWGAGDW